jgi:hypothetical protein
MNELEHISNELKLATEVRNIKSKLEKLTPLLNKLEDLIDAKDVNVTKLIAIVGEYKRIKSVEE